MRHRNALCIINPKSRSGRAALGEAMDQLQRHGISLIPKQSSSPSEIADLIRTFAPAINQVILAGGDGTMQAAAAALIETRLPFGILPLGTANDLARSLNIPADLRRACDIILAGNRRQIDVGSVNGVYYFNVAHLGLAIRVTQQLSHQAKARWGVFSYGICLVKAVRKTEPFTAVIRCNGQTQPVRSIQISIGNGRHYGGGMTVAEGAALDDHLLHLYSVEPNGWLSLFRLAITLRKGPPRHAPGLVVLASREFEIETEQPMPILSDGEITTTTPARFGVVPEAVTVFAPQPLISARP